MSHVTSLIYALQINEDQPNEKCKSYLYAIIRKSAAVTCILAETDRTGRQKVGERGCGRNPPTPPALGMP